jgi:hypothetical protein
MILSPLDAIRVDGELLHCDRRAGLDMRVERGVSMYSSGVPWYLYLEGLTGEASYSLWYHREAQLGMRQRSV